MVFFDKDDPNSKVSRIMMTSRLTRDPDRSDTKCLTLIPSNGTANCFAVKSARLQWPQQFDGHSEGYGLPGGLFSLEATPFLPHT
jgi:hypothetical protein